jgi:hypothetical protein
MMRIFRRDFRICPTETYYSDMASWGKIKINKNNDMCTVAGGRTRKSAFLAVFARKDRIIIVLIRQIRVNLCQRKRVSVLIRG